MSMARNISISALIAGIALLGGCGGGGGSDSNNGGTGAGTSDNNSTGTPNAGSGGNPGNESPGSTASYAYILQAAANASSTTVGTNYEGGSILKCAVDASGSLSACSTAGMPALNHPVSLTFSGSTAYILNQTVPVPQWGGQYPVLKCTVEANGTLSGCADTLPPGDSLETEDALKILSGPVSAYVLKESQLLMCRGDFTGKCGTDPSSISFTADVLAQDMILADNRIYVVNAGSDKAPASILSASLDPATGALSKPTAATDASFASALRFDASTTDTPIGMAIKGSNAYILTAYGNKVIQCSYDSAANTMTACTSTAPLAGLNGIVPKSIAIQGNYAYVTDSSSTPAENSVAKCDIGNDGKLGNCALESGPSFATAIVNLAFH